MVANKFPPQLRKPLLEFVQFRTWGPRKYQNVGGQNEPATDTVKRARSIIETVRIDAVVDDAFAKFKNQYYLNEPVNVAWDKST